MTRGDSNIDEAMGPVEVDHGLTGCKPSLAADYVERTSAPRGHRPRSRPRP